MAKPKRPPYKTVKIVSEQGLVFELHRGLAIELNSYSPYVFGHRSARSAIHNGADSLLYSIGTSEITADLAVVSITPNSIRFGCQQWTGINAKKLREWAA